MMAHAGTAVVAGGARGIGESVARRLAARGFKVLILDLDGAAAGQVASSIEALGGVATASECDLTDIAAVQGVASELSSRGEAVAVLVNSAGWSPVQRFADQGPDVWRKVVDVNFIAVLNTCAAFLPLTIENGSIVNIASDAARIGVADQAVYAGSKAAVIAFSKSLAVEVAPRTIRVNVVCPGSTLTPMLREMFNEDELAKRVRIIPLKRFAEPEDVATTVSFLAVDADHVTGQVLSVNGGALRAG